MSGRDFIAAWCISIIATAVLVGEIAAAFWLLGNNLIGGTIALLVALGTVVWGSWLLERS